MWGISRLTGDLLASQEGLCCMELTHFFVSCVVWPVINCIPMLLSNTLFVQVDLACVYLLLVETAVLLMWQSWCIHLHVKVTVQWPCWYSWYMSISQWELKHSICHVIAKTDCYMTTSFWRQAWMNMYIMMVIQCGRIRSGSLQRTGQLPVSKYKVTFLHTIHFSWNTCTEHGYSPVQSVSIIIFSNCIGSWSLSNPSIRECVLLYWKQEYYVGYMRVGLRCKASGVLGNCCGTMYKISDTMQ